MEMPIKIKAITNVTMPTQRHHADSMELAAFDLSPFSEAKVSAANAVSQISFSVSSSAVRPANAGAFA